MKNNVDLSVNLWGLLALCCSMHLKIPYPIKLHKSLSLYIYLEEILKFSIEIYCFIRFCLRSLLRNKY
jgi:hypothetical protein